MRRAFLVGGILLTVLLLGFLFLTKTFPFASDRGLSTGWGNIFGFRDSEENGFFEPRFGIDPPRRFVSFLDGKSFEGSQKQEFAIGVMIDNVPQARPLQKGLEEAALVIEALTEGGITRLLAIFSSQKNLPEIGPIRSTRPYFLDFFRPLGGVLVHAGGSDEVLGTLDAQTDVIDLDHGELSAADETFWRSRASFAPHNLFTSSQRLRTKIITQAELPAILAQPVFPFEKDALSGSAVEAVAIDFSHSFSSSEWVWNEEKSAFDRIQNNSVLSVSASNLLILEMPSFPLNDGFGHVGFEHIGSGALLFFQNGNSASGTWQKENAAAPFLFADAAGNPLGFLPGLSWIVLVDDLNMVKVSAPSVSETSAS